VAIPDIKVGRYVYRGRLTLLMSFSRVTQDDSVGACKEGILHVSVVGV
jgi:hypothetical protein